MWFGLMEETTDQIREVPTASIRRSLPTKYWIGLEKGPLGQGREFAAGLHDRDDLAFGEQIEAAAEGAALATGALRKPSKYAMVAEKERDGLTCLAEVPMPHTDGFITKRRHSVSSSA
jgi:hypothetical protein